MYMFSPPFEVVTFFQTKSFKNGSALVVCHSRCESIFTSVPCMFFISYQENQTFLSMPKSDSLKKQTFLSDVASRIEI